MSEVRNRSRVTDSRGAILGLGVDLRRLTLAAVTDEALALLQDHPRRRLGIPPALFDKLAGEITPEVVIRGRRRQIGFSGVRSRIYTNPDGEHHLELSGRVRSLPLPRMTLTVTNSPDAQGLVLTGRGAGLLQQLAPQVVDVDGMVRTGIEAALPGFVVHGVEVGPDAVYADIAKASGRRRGRAA